MSEKQQRRADILARLSGGSLSTAQASPLLGVSERQVRRLRQRYEAQGMASVVHGNVGKEPKNKTDMTLLARVSQLAGASGLYAGISVSHLCDLLQERHQIVLPRSTLDRLLKQEGIRHAKGRGKQAQRRHQKRARQPSEGMLVQIDGSPHDWLQGREGSGSLSRLCLVGAIDDATSRVLYLRFHANENQEAYLLLLRQIAVEFGLPMAFYHDHVHAGVNRHTILRSPKKATLEEELAGQEPRSQIQRVLHELGVESIAALSPQAKGRIERLWKTLQDRLVTELRLAGIDTREQANAFLPAFMQRFNARFAQVATDLEPAWVPLPSELDLCRHFSVQEFRTVKADQTISYAGQCLLLTERKRSWAGERVAVHVTPEGQTRVYGGQGAKEPLSFQRFERFEHNKPIQKAPKTPETPEANALPKSRPKSDSDSVSPSDKSTLSTPQRRAGAWRHGRWTESLSN